MNEIELFRKSIKQGRKMLGSNISLKDMLSTEIVTRTMDFVWLDMEHGGLNIESVENHILAAKKNGKAALVRIPELGEDWIKMVLDAGAHGLIIPRIRTEVEVGSVIEYTKYYPEGKRGFGPRVPFGYDKNDNIRGYIEWANRNIYIAIQIETKEAYKKLDKILTIKGFDAVCIGPADLSMSLGYYADIRCPEMMKIFKDVINRAKSAKKDVGFGTGFDLKYCQKIMRMGVDWLQIGEDYNYINSKCIKIYNKLKEVNDNYEI